MTDRELLELAAKAAGIEVRWRADDIYGGSFECRVAPEPEAPYSKWLYWRPLIDDGDALRLAVDLQLCTSTGELACAASWPPHSAWLHEVVEKHDGDKRAAMRRAIVRAAAEIAKQNPA